MNISHETLKRIEAQLDRLEGMVASGRDADSKHREAWLVAGFRPGAHGDFWAHDDGRHMPYPLILTTMPEE
jgi:hypothetical protein